jgi:Mannosyltransferase putative
MITCQCNRVTSDRWDTTQCWDCWRLANIRAIQRGNGIKNPELLRERFPMLAKLGVYNSTMEAIAANNGHMPSPVARSLPVVERNCIYEDANKLGIARRCNTCDSHDDNSPRHVRWCDHPAPTIDRSQFEESDWCTRIEVDPKILSCDKCPDKRRNLFGGFPDPLHPQTAATDEIAHIAAFKSMLTSHPDYPGDDGRTGIIWTCHSPRFWIMCCIAVRILRRVLGCRLPVQVWYRSSCGAFDKSLVAGLDVEFCDRDEMAARLGDSRLGFGDPNQGGWQVKTYAATHTSFAKFWVMDSDAMFVGDPTDIVPDCPFGYWIDLYAFDHSNVWTNWVKYGFSEPGKEVYDRRVRWALNDQVRQVQGGHLWFDKKAAWKLICMAQQANEHSDYWYTHSNHDQSVIRGALAWGACPGYRVFDDLEQGRFPENLGQSSWIQDAFACRYEGKPLITHYARHKLFLDWLTQCDRIPLDRERLREYAALILEMCK